MLGLHSDTSKGAEGIKDNLYTECNIICKLQSTLTSRSHSENVFLARAFMTLNKLNIGSPRTQIIAMEHEKAQVIDIGRQVSWQETS